jgi:hypothetical protein
MQQDNLVLAEASADLNMAMAAPCQKQPWDDTAPTASRLTVVINTEPKRGTLKSIHYCLLAPSIKSIQRSQPGQFENVTEP